MKLIDWQIIHATIRSSAPIIIAVVAVIISKKANVFNMAIEGIMLFGALISVIVNSMTGSWILALIASILSGVLIGTILGIFHIKLNANILVLGFATNTLALGGTRFIMQRLFGIVGAYTPRDLVPIPVLNFRIFSGNPVLQSLFSGYSLLEYLSFIFVFILWFFLNKTQSGLRLRSVGLNETAAKTAGINVERTKIVAIIVSGAIAGIAGAHLSMSYTKMFVEGMSGGRGFMAIAAVNFGDGRPLTSLIAALIFGFSESLGLRLQSLGFPSQFVLMMPYVVTVVALTVSMVRQSRREKLEKIRELNRQREELFLS